MIEFRAYLKQKGSGCDYTIDCGKTMILLKASNMQEAKEQLKYIIEESYVGEFELEYCTILEIANIESLDLKSIYDELKNKKLKDKEDLERQEYERLKNKFEK